MQQLKHIFRVLIVCPLAVLCMVFSLLSPVDHVTLATDAPQEQSSYPIAEIGADRGELNETEDWSVEPTSAAGPASSCFLQNIAQSLSAIPLPASVQVPPPDCI